MDGKLIGKRIKEERKRKLMRQEDLAERTNKLVTYIGMIERGERIPGLSTFIEIVNALDTTADEILCDFTNNGYKVRFSKYNEQIDKLNTKEKRALYEIVEAYLKNQ